MVDVARARRDAAIDIKNEGGIVLQIKKPTYAGGVKTGDTSVYGHALVLKTIPSVDKDIRNDDVTLAVSGLQSTAAGDIISTVLTIEKGDMIVWDSREMPVLRPNAAAPTGEVILYDKLMAGIRKSA